MLVSIDDGLCFFVFDLIFFALECFINISSIFIRIFVALHHKIFFILVILRDAHRDGLIQLGCRRLSPHAYRRCDAILRLFLFLATSRHEWAHIIERLKDLNLVFDGVAGGRNLFFRRFCGRGIIVSWFDHIYVKTRRRDASIAAVNYRVCAQDL